MSVLMHGRWESGSRTLSHPSNVVPAGEDQRWRLVVSGADEGSGVLALTATQPITVDGFQPWSIRVERLVGGSWTEITASGGAFAYPPSSGADLYATITATADDGMTTAWMFQFVGSMARIPYRPYAVRMNDLYQVPDGIFDPALGKCLMGVRVENTWGLDFEGDAFVDISASSRASLLANGITIDDLWTADEIDSSGNPAQVNGQGFSVGGLPPHGRRTVYFKLDVSQATSQKQEIEIVISRGGGSPDPENVKRRSTRFIFILLAFEEPGTGRVGAVVPEGTLFWRLQNAMFSSEEMRRAMVRYQQGQPIDLYPPGGEFARDSKFLYGPFYSVPIRFRYETTPAMPFAGQLGDIPFQDPWWKVVLLVLAAILRGAATVNDAVENAYVDPDVVIGTLQAWAKDNFDVAIARLNGSRSLPSGTIGRVLDAQPSEPNQDPVASVGSVVVLDTQLLPYSGSGGDNLVSIAAMPMSAPERRFFKSGLRTGLTHAILVGFDTFIRDSDNVRFDTPQLAFESDPFYGGGFVANKGDSGSVFVQTSSLRPAGLLHSTVEGGGDSWASPLSDIFTTFNLSLA